MAVIIQFGGWARVTHADQIETAGDVPPAVGGQIRAGGLHHIATLRGRHALGGGSQTGPTPRPHLDEHQLVVVLMPDAGRSYMEKIFNDDWMRANGFADVVERTTKPSLAEQYL